MHLPSDRRDHSCSSAHLRPPRHHQSRGTRRYPDLCGNDFVDRPLSLDHSRREEAQTRPPYLGHPTRVWSENALYQFVGQLLWLITTGIIKISILLYYRRLSGSFSPKFKIASWVGIWYNIAFMVGFLCVGMLYCRPLAAYWLQFDLQWVSEGHTWSCPVDQRLSLPVSGALSVVGDFYSTLLPLCLVYTLNMPKRQKRALYLLFVFGFLVVTAGLVRTILLTHLTRSTYDSSWWSYKAWTWSMLELYLAIIIASAPALKPFFRKYLVDPIGGTLHRSRRYGGSHDGGSWPARSLSDRGRPSCSSPYQNYHYEHQASLSPLFWKDPSSPTKGPRGYFTRVCHEEKV